MLTVISGGTGTPKLLQGLTEVVSQKDISVVVNTGEDVEITGLRVSPDLDTVVYTLGGIIDDENWYGIEGDSFTTYEMLRTLGHYE
ncbi:2-phospho-L-lactate transferase, partial [candidate division MSBL1 archaeon SCGC-AAA259D18]